jgi:hypothetical protein
MHSAASESRGQTRKAARPAMPAPIRYPLAAVRYPLVSLVTGGQKTAQSDRRESYTMALPRRMKRTARGLLLWSLFWYLIAQLALFVWMGDSWKLNRVRVEQQKWKQLHELLAQAPDRPLVLMLGSSRTDWAFEAGRLDGQPGPDGRPLLVYNFGVPTTGPIHEALYLNDLLDQGIRPRLLLVEFVTSHLNQSRRGLLSEEHFTVPLWLSAHQLLFFRPFFSNPRKALIEWVQSRVSPWYAFRWYIHEHFQGHDEFLRPYEQSRQPMNSWGCRILSDDPGTPEYRAWRWQGALRMYGPTLQQFRLGAKPTQAMHDLLARCCREQIPVAIVLMPITKEFRELIPAEGRAELDHLVAELCNRYRANLIDASEWLDREDFDDGHHVLKTGAHKFSMRMIDEVQKLLARTEASEP